MKELSKQNLVRINESTARRILRYSVENNRSLNVYVVCHNTRTKTFTSEQDLSEYCFIDETSYYAIDVVDYLVYNYERGFLTYNTICGVGCWDISYRIARELFGSGYRIIAFSDGNNGVIDTLLCLNNTENIIFVDDYHVDKKDRKIMLKSVSANLLGNSYKDALHSIGIGNCYNFRHSYLYPIKINDIDLITILTKFEDRIGHRWIKLSSVSPTVNTRQKDKDVTIHVNIPKQLSKSEEEHRNQIAEKNQYNGQTKYVFIGGEYVKVTVLGYGNYYGRYNCYICAKCNNEKDLVITSRLFDIHYTTI